jgi:hypothetical protein
VKILLNTSREEWLEQRRNVVTATDVARLHLGGPGTWRTVRAEKNGKTRDLSNNPAIKWGVAREPFISDYVTLFADQTLTHNDKLILSDEDERFAATPDMIGPNSIGEIKTTKHDWDEIPQNYLLQVQWQLFVTGMRWCVFAWEVHDNYTPVEIKHQVIHADPQIQQELKATALRFLAGDENIPTADQVEWSILIEEYKRAFFAQQEAKHRLDAAKEKMRERAGGKDMKFSSDCGAITIFTPKPAARFDAKRFKEDHPDLHAEYMRQGASTTQQVKVTLPKKDGE